MGDLRSACHQLSDDKVTVRKKAEEQLRHLLSNPSIISSLNHASSRGSQIDLKWDDVYNCTVNFLLKETAKLESDLAKDGGGAGGRAGRAGRAGQAGRATNVFSFYKLVVKKGWRHISAGKLLSNLLDWLGDGFKRSQWADSLAGLLLDLVHDPACRTGIKSWQWLQLLDTAQALFHTPAGLDSSMVARLLGAAVQVGGQAVCLTTRLCKPDLWELTGQALSSVQFGRPDSAAQLELVRAAGWLVALAGLDHREAACRLGEKSLQAVVQVWRGRREEEQQVVVEFLQLQLAVHCPAGVTEPEAGALYCDRKLWTHQLARVWRHVVETGVRARLKTCRSRNSRQPADYELPASLATLAGSVALQLAAAPAGTVPADLTQLIDTQQQDTQPAKRLRVSGPGVGPGLETVLAELRASPLREEELLPWLQILAALLVRHPTAARGGAGAELWRAVVAVVHSAQQPAVRELAWQVVGRLAEEQAGSEDWAGLGKLLHFRLSSDLLGPQGQNLLQAALAQPAAGLDSGELYRMFCSRLVRPTAAAQASLACLLAKHPLRGGREAETRRQLLAWLLAAPHLSPRAGQLLHSVACPAEQVEELQLKQGTPIQTELELERDLAVLVCHRSPPASIELVPRETGPIRFRNHPGLPELLQQAEQGLVVVAGQLLAPLQDNQVVMPSCLLPLISLLSCLLSYTARAGEQGRIHSLAISTARQIATATTTLLAGRDRGGDSAVELVQAWINVTTEHSDSKLMQEIMDSADLKSLLAGVDRLVDTICTNKKQEGREPTTVETRRRSHTTSPDSMGDFDEDFDVGFDDEPEIATDTMDVKAEPEREAEELLRAGSFLTLLAASQPELALARLEQLLEVFQYSPPVLALLHPTFTKLTSASPSQDCLEHMLQLLISLAKQCLVKDRKSQNKDKYTKFYEAGLMELVKMLGVLAPAVHRRGSDTSRKYFVRILENVLESNYDCSASLQEVRNLLTLSMKTNHFLITTLSLVVNCPLTEALCRCGLGPGWCWRWWRWWGCWPDWVPTGPSGAYTTRSVPSQVSHSTRTCPYRWAAPYLGSSFTQQPPSGDT